MLLQVERVLEALVERFFGLGDCGRNCLGGDRVGGRLGVEPHLELNIYIYIYI